MAIAQADEALYAVVSGPACRLFPLPGRRWSAGRTTWPSEPRDLAQPKRSGNFLSAKVLLGNLISG